MPSHRYVAQLVKQQLHNLEGVIEDGAERLGIAAKAKDFRGLIAEQAKRYPASRKRLGQDLKATWALTADTGRELGSIASQTYAQLVHGVRIKLPRQRHGVGAGACGEARPPRRIKSAPVRGASLELPRPCRHFAHRQVRTDPAVIIPRQL